MAGYFSLGENKIRPGAYFNVQKRGDETNFGAIDGVVAVLFKSSIGPLGKATVLPASEGYKNTFGTGGTTDALREAFYGGAVKLIAVRVGNGGTVGSASLACATGKAKLSTKYPAVQNLQQQSERSLAIPQRRSASYIWMALSSKR